MGTRPLYKHTIVIWTSEESGLENAGINELADEATDGLAYCSTHTVEHVKNPEKDPNWDNTEFFMDEDDEDDDE